MSVLGERVRKGLCLRDRDEVISQEGSVLTQVLGELRRIRAERGGMGREWILSFSHPLLGGKNL